MKIKEKNMKGGKGDSGKEIYISNEETYHLIYSEC
jgi:hypothetical protein